ncbi:metalloregulator ArsR/SmtB family transcription factor [Anaerobacillus isosaccharinicus]|uniref:ArsR family transcriptional regulator n=1 Tax=Anaerobacillus isosaccharinicus TaxID=1532552 RepID=A0A1S2M7Z9_9BACI|nr:metalloregulator ArsR/SmtB family transcription factor [Anaerobacillus isosaccharinicus]MBA5588404.1 metalloregulator ArsR/SmtB family transcription factor [Anaerobacillus isosaccharinicus]QOY38165.1 metalloregulator ArsR/SmtB family transcription factor [Anaerobacillus isosaccharinicus]
MQLNRLVNFHKTIGDKTRIRIIALLKEGPLHGQALAGKLGLTPPTISHHIAKLREIDIIYQRRDKNTIYFHLNEKKLEVMAQAILKIGIEDEAKLYQYKEEEKEKVLKNFIQQDGRLKNLPAQHKKRLIILEHLVTKLEIGKTYSENEINEFIKQYHEDYATIRREFVMYQFMFRQDGEYELNPKEMWLI